MIMVGSNITSSADKLVKVSEEYLFHSLIRPNPDIAARIRQLRIIYQLDPKLYSRQKRALPYFVCGAFNPPFRRSENFAYTESFVVDIDHLTAKGLSLLEVRRKVQTDSRVHMCFTSPSEDGLKLMFRLKERCYDAGVYSLFYKKFVAQFAAHHSLQQVVDSATSDVSRACFISVDDFAHYNPNSDTIDVMQYVDTSNPFETLSEKRKLDQETKEADNKAKAERREYGLSDPDQEIMLQIKQRLNPNGPHAKEKPTYYVPAQLEEIIQDLRTYVEETGLVVTAISSIQYGKKISVKLGMKQAEINLFYGKRGFSVVKSPKCGTTPELNDVVAELIQGFIDTH